MNSDLGIAYIITNTSGNRSKRIFDTMCNRAIALCRKNGTRKSEKPLPIAVISIESQKTINADIHIDANPYLKQYYDQTTHGLILAELLKTHICEWSPFKRTIYLDCDTMVRSAEFKQYANILSLGYKLSMTTCATMNWKDSLYDTDVRSEYLDGIPKCFPYWNFGIFGSDRENSKDLLESIREEYLSYCFGKSLYFGTKASPHAQPAIVRAAFKRAPNHGIFTMPSRFNVHLSSKGTAFPHTAMIIHLHKDIREWAVS